MDGADVCRTSSRASWRPPYVISTVAILDPRWLRRKWRHPGPGAGFSTPIAEAEENGGPSASGRHLGWPHLREPEMRSSKMATGSGRAAIFLRLRNGGRKNRPILLAWDIVRQVSVPIGVILRTSNKWSPHMISKLHADPQITRDIAYRVTFVDKLTVRGSVNHGAFRKWLEDLKYPSSQHFALVYIYIYIYIYYFNMQGRYFLWIFKGYLKIHIKYLAHILQ